jgi:hypothetical protein
MVKNEHPPTNINVFSVKRKVPPDWNQLAVHDITGHRSRGDVNLKNKNDRKIKNGDWHNLQEYVQKYPIPTSFCTIGTLDLKSI